MSRIVVLKRRRMQNCYATNPRFYSDGSRMSANIKKRRWLIAPTENDGSNSDSDHNEATNIDSMEENANTSCTFFEDGIETMRDIIRLYYVGDDFGIYSYAQPRNEDEEEELRQMFRDTAYFFQFKEYMDIYRSMVEEYNFWILTEEYYLAKRSLNGLDLLTNNA